MEKSRCACGVSAVRRVDGWNAEPVARNPHRRREAGHLLGAIEAWKTAAQLPSSPHHPCTGYQEQRRQYQHENAEKPSHPRVNLNGKLQFIFVSIPFRADLRAFLTEFTDQHSGVRLGRMFGLPAGYVGRRLFVCLMEDGIIVRLPVDVAQREIKKKAQPFSRKGGTLGAWVMYRPRTIVEARRLAPVLERAAQHVAERQVEDLTGLTVRRRR